MKLVHIIGPKTGHALRSRTRRSRSTAAIDAIVEQGPQPAARTTSSSPPARCATTRMHWLTVEPRTSTGSAPASTRECSVRADSMVSVTTTNVTGTLARPRLPADRSSASQPMTIDARRAEIHATSNGHGLVLHFTQSRRQSWRPLDIAPCRRRQTSPSVHGLQGPIDDAFMDSFLMVAADRQADERRRSASGPQPRWSTPSTHWRQQFRGEAQRQGRHRRHRRRHRRTATWSSGATRRATRCWPRSPTSCRSSGTADGVDVGDKTYDAGHHVPVLIYPNPLNPKRYVVLNSGFTFREYDYLNNARQVPKLPDCAVIDITTPPNSRWPGKVVTAGFFDEKWKLPAAEK